MIEFFTEALGMVLQPQFLLLIAVTSIIGVMLGALPGIGPTLTMALAFPFTFVLNPETGLMIMAVLYGSTTFGGSVSAILLNVPGTAGSAATLLDGYPLTKQGKASQAIGVATISSFTGAMIGLLFLALMGPLLARLALLLGPPQMFLLAVLGLATVSAVSRGSMFKGFVAACFGIVLASIGIDPVSATPRFTGGIFFFRGGIDLVVMLIGLFAVSQVIDLAVKQTSISESGSLTGSAWEGVKETSKHKFAVARGSVVGSIIGSIPGAGITTANFLSYIIAVNMAKDPEKFGTGDVRGVIAAESANNASTMGALVPAMTLAIPGGASAAIFIGAMLSYGITPGPAAFEGALPYVIFISIAIGNLVFLVMGIRGAEYVSKVTVIRQDLIIAAIVTLAVVGSYTVRNNLNDVGVAVIIGIIGYAMRQRGYSLVAFVLGFILGPIAERGFQRSMIVSDGSYLIFVDSLLSITLLVASVVLFLTPVILRVRKMLEA